MPHKGFWYDRDEKFERWCADKIQTYWRQAGFSWVECVGSADLPIRSNMRFVDGWKGPVRAPGVSFGKEEK